MRQELHRLQKRLDTRIGRAARDFGLFDDGDRVMVCLSGGKDSYTMLTLLREMKARVPFRLDLVAFHLDQKQPGYPAGVMVEYLDELEIEHRIVEEDTYSIVQEKLDPGETPCSLCSRLRRGIIYGTAEELGCNKIALGHHRDDSIETLLMNMFHQGQLQAMPAKYTTDDGRFEVIRPMIYIAEEEIARYAELMDYPIIPCNLCGSVQTQRNFTKNLLDELEESIPHIRNSILAALGNVRTTHLLDTDLLEETCGDDAREKTSPARTERAGAASSCATGDRLF